MILLWQALASTRPVACVLENNPMSRSKTLILLLMIFLVSGCSPAAAPPRVITQVVTAVAPALVVTATETPLPVATPSPTLPPLRTPEVRETLPAEGVVNFKILHWNDFHGYLGEDNVYDTWVPGAARLAAFVNAEREQAGADQTLVLDAGDWYEGSSSSYDSLGEKVWEFYHLLGVDAIVVGNHELFWGTPRFYRMVSQAPPIEILSVNMRRVSADKLCSEERIVNPYKIFELGSDSGPKVRVAVIGVSALNMEAYAPAPVHDVCFPNPVSEILKLYDQLLAIEQPDVLVVLSHIGFEEDQELAEALNAAGKPVDLIIGGHSHTWIETPAKVGETLVVTAGEWARAVGVFDLTYNRTTASLETRWRQEIFTPCSPEDPATLNLLKDALPETKSKTPQCSAVRQPNADYLVDLTAVSATVGFWTLGQGEFPASEAAMIIHQPISSHEKTYPFGLFAHAPSNLQYTLNGQYTRFITEISLNQSACGDGAQFAVSLDGKEIYHSPNLLPSTAPIALDLDVSGGQRLKLETLPGPDVSCDWTIWGDPYLVKPPTP